MLATNRRRRSTTRLALGAALSWVVVFGGLRAFVVQAEACGSPSVAAIRAAVDETVGWFDRNQNADGTWLYRYDKEADADLGGYNIVRHAGVTMSLYQAAAIGTGGALEVADAGAAWALENLTPAGDGLALWNGGLVGSGATGLLVAGLAERREATGDTVHDDVLVAMGRFLAATVEDDGAVLAYWDLDTDAPVPGQYSHYFTGEVGWALARLHHAFPTEGFGPAARRVARYLTIRDGTEGRFPPVPDHWAAYTLDELGRWSDAAAAVVTPPPPLDEPELDYALRLAGLFGAQVRYESQRDTGWWTHLTRGRRTLAAGLGTLGEGLTGLWLVAGTEPGQAHHELHDARDDIAERAGCVAGMLLDRQVDAEEAAREADPSRTQGAWFQFGITQMDGQQHAMSALLRTIPILEPQEVAP